MDGRHYKNPKGLFTDSPAKRGKLYRVIESGVMPSGFKGYLVEDFWGKTSWKSVTQLKSLRAEKRIVADWDTFR